MVIALAKMDFPAVNAPNAKPMSWVITVICANQTTSTIQIAKVCLVLVTFKVINFFAECKCDLDGSASLQCDANGHCTCKEGYNGSKCDECKPNIIGNLCDKCQKNYYGYPNCQGLFKILIFFLTLASVLICVF